MQIDKKKNEGHHEFIPHAQLTCGQILSLIQRMFIECNSFYASYTVRIAYLCYLFASNLPSQKKIDVQKAVLLGLFRNVGDYHFAVEKVMDYDDLTEQDIRERYVYSYAWVKNMTPISELAQAYLFYDTDYNPEIAEKNIMLEYGSIVFAAERIVKLLRSGGSVDNPEDLYRYRITRLNPEYVDLFKRLDEKWQVSTNLSYSVDKDGKEQMPPCAKYMEDVYQSFSFSREDTDKFFKTLVSVIDFKSSFTVWHTIHTAGYACSLGKFYGCTEDIINYLFTAGVLHDIGKIAVPQGILESSGKLRKWEFRVIQTHVTKTEQMVKDLVNPIIAKMAYRHHEKLNGQGYPHGLTDKDLTVPERIVQVADVLSALVDKRSYKDEMSEDQLLEIFKEMVDKGELDPSIVSLVENGFGVLQAHRDNYSNLLILPLGNVEIDFWDELSLSL